ncbi:hypothetical protein ACI65C_004896 [Semiaphis heraclei]
MKDKKIIPEIPVPQNELKITKDIVWYMNNAELKKSKMSNTSIKIECFHVPINKSSSNEMLGYLLLKLKGAQTFNPTSNDRIENESYKLIGSKNCSYHFNLSLRIEDNKNNVKAIDKLTDKIKNIKPKIKDNSKNEEEIKYHDENVEKSVVNISSEQINLPENDNSQKIFTCIQQKLIEELEDWKDKQMLLFNEKVIILLIRFTLQCRYIFYFVYFTQMKTKEEQLLKDFNDKWSDNRKQSEEELTNAMSKCKELAKDLEKKSDILKEKDAIFTAKELELIEVADMQFSNAQKINELSDTFSELEAKLHTSEKLNILLRKENEALKYDFDTNCSLQVQELEKKIANLEYKIEETNKSCVFFKERWIASVKKLNELYSKFHETKTNKHLLKNKQNIRNIFINSLEEWLQEKQQIRTLLNGLGKLRQDMTNTNYLNF